MSLSDKIHNARSILRDLRKPEIGARIWKRFKPSKADTLWYYREVANAFQKLLPGQLADELAEIVGGFKKARVAVARKLAVILHAMWKTNTPFHWRANAT
ncbi:hypothetical protein [Pseudorhodoplanes sp.]|uniref:hypothetical protein n=1 Tax=Pseudorhodoplanes sp. TaxID=1934341 RepID=UPI003D0EDA4B